MTEPTGRVFLDGSSMHAIAATNERNYVLMQYPVYQSIMVSGRK